MCAHTPQKEVHHHQEEVVQIGTCCPVPWKHMLEKCNDDSMKAALKAVEDGQSVSGARDYGIPKTTLFDYVSGRVIHGVKPGPRPHLSPRERKVPLDTT